MIDKYREEAVTPDVGADVVAIVSPHAGYIYSGPVAAYGYNVLEDVKPDVVIVLAPSHRARFRGASIIAEGIFETPLGKVPIDAVIGKQLLGRDSIVFLEEVDAYEHSLEVQVPFLQTVVDDFKLVPVIIGTTDLDLCQYLAKEIYSVVKEDKRRIAIVISTDLSHYHSYDEAVRIDGRLIESLKSFDEEKLSDLLDSGSSEACGQGPLLTGMILSKLMGATQVKILHYANSGDTSGDKSRVVGYLSAAFIK